MGDKNSSGNSVIPKQIGKPFEPSDARIQYIALLAHTFIDKFAVL